METVTRVVNEGRKNQREKLFSRVCKLNNVLLNAADRFCDVSKKLNEKKSKNNTPRFQSHASDRAEKERVEKILSKIAEKFNSLKFTFQKT